MPRLNNVSKILKVSLKRNYNLSSVSLLGGVVKWPLTSNFPKQTFRQSTQILGYMRRFIFLYTSLFTKEKEASLLENLFISWDLLFQGMNYFFATRSLIASLSVQSLPAQHPPFKISPLFNNRIPATCGAAIDVPLMVA